MLPALRPDGRCTPWCKQKMIAERGADASRAKQGQPSGTAPHRPIKCIRAVDLKHRLREINPNRANFAHRGLP